MKNTDYSIKNTTFASYFFNYDKQGDNFRHVYPWFHCGIDRGRHHHVTSSAQ